MNIKSYMLETPARTERISFNIKMNKDDLAANQRDIDIITNGMSIGINADSTLDLDYALVVEYFGRTNQVLEAILRIQEKGVPVWIDYEELNYGKSLILQIGELIEKLKN